MLELDKTNFEEKVLKAEGYVVVDYYGDGCEPCMALKPHFHDLADQYGDKMTFAALNISKARRVAIGQKVLGLPVIAVYQNGEKVEELVKEAATPEAVSAMVAKYAAQ